MNVIDSSLLYALFNRQDQWHEEAKAAVQRAQPIVVPPGILQETLDLVRLRHGRPAAEAAFLWMDGEPAFNLESEGDDGFSFARRQLRGPLTRNPKLSLADLACMGTCLALDADLMTKDADQLAAWHAGRPLRAHAR